MTPNPHRRQASGASSVAARKRFLFLLIGVFLILAPASVSSQVAGGAILKWARVGVLLLMMLAGFPWFRLPSISDLSGKVLLLSVVFTIASLWSTQPILGLLFKGMFVCSVVAAISLANCLRNEWDFRVLARTTTLSALVAAVWAGYLFLVVQDFYWFKSRLFLAGMNPNSMGLSAAIFALLGVFHLMIRDRGIWKLLPWLVILAMAVLIIYSGSRAAVLTSCAGLLLLLPSLAKNRRNVVALSVFSFLMLLGVGAVWFSMYSEVEVSHLGDASYGAAGSNDLRLVAEMNRDTRTKIWMKFVHRWIENDLILGFGWLNVNGRWTLVQSSYLQIMLESGLFGVVALLVFFLGAARTLYRAMFWARRIRGFGSMLLYLFSAAFFAVAFHGVFESAMVVGSSPNAVLVAFSAAQLDLHLKGVTRYLASRRQVTQNVPGSLSATPVT